MGPEQHARWKNEVLNEVFRALASSPELREALIFKGARVLNRRLAGERMSLDLDSCLSADFALATASTQVQGEFLRETVRRAVTRHFSEQREVRYTLEAVEASSLPHPLGWHGHTLRLRVRDAQLSHVLGLPPVELDIGAPEALSAHAVSELAVDHQFVRAYTLERIAGEKLRAFLTTLPRYRQKVKKLSEVVRVKDLYDLSVIAKVKPLTDEGFWRQAGEEFRQACASRRVDCEGLATFQENWLGTRIAYERDRTLPKDVSFAQAEAVLTAVVLQWEKWGLIPFVHPLPNANAGGSRAPA